MTDRWLLSMQRLESEKMSQIQGVQGNLTRVVNVQFSSFVSMGSRYTQRILTLFH